MKETTTIEARDKVPLDWPQGWSRTLIDQRQSRSMWKKSFSFYREQVLKELERVGAGSVRISRNDPSKERVDPGVAVWFSLKPAADFSWQTALHLDSPVPSLDEIENAFRNLARKHHPDAVANNSGGDVAMFHKLSDHRKKARAWVLGGEAPPLDNCIPCDRFVTQQQNLAAIRLALGAFRQLERVGIPAILERVMDRAFKAALPAAEPKREEVGSGAV